MTSQELRKKLASILGVPTIPGHYGYCTCDKCTKDFWRYVDSQLAILREAIKGIENPHIDGIYRQEVAFNQAIQSVLKLLGEEVKK